MPRLVQTDATTEAALAAAVSRLGWCEALSAALGDAYRVVWRTSGGDAVVTCVMTGSLPVSEQTCRVSAQPASVTCASGTPTQTLLEGADGTRWAKLDRMVPLVDSQGAALAPVAGAGFTWVQPLVVMPPAGLSRLPAWLQDAPLLTWGQISGTTLTSVLNSLNYAGGTNPYGILAYSGGAKCGNELVLIGGGHNNWYGNDVYGCDLSADAPAFTQRFIGTPAASRGTAWQTTGYFDDGRPCSRHTRWTPQYDPVRGKVFLFGNAGMGNLTNFPMPNVDAFDLAANDYDAAGTWPGLAVNVTAGDGFCRDGAGNYWQARAQDGDLYYANRATMSWSNVSGGDVTGAVKADTGMIYDPVRNRLFQIRTLYQPTRGRIFDLDSMTGAMPAQSLAPAYTGAMTSMDLGAAVAYCGDLDRYLVVQFAQTTIYAIHPDTMEVSVLAVAGTTPTTDTTPSRESDYYDRFAWYEDLGAVVMHARADTNISFIRTR